MALIEVQVTEEERNAFMIVAGLLVTAMYQTVLSPVGGLNGLTHGGSYNEKNEDQLSMEKQKSTWACGTVSPVLTLPPLNHPTNLLPFSAKLPYLYLSTLF
ncbi:hypothetical protein PIB30_020297 [Stylosanthes scabra]|uniref:Uncharacterized protein n=1 Tax=Stylosanthes scabra TaxID=79078 RepID=A0ABU6V8P0_9FABA|nr:hypothetical protein [Stylosanthes scabra]